MDSRYMIILHYRRIYCCHIEGLLSFHLISMMGCQIRRISIDLMAYMHTCQVYCHKLTGEGGACLEII